MRSLSQGGKDLRNGTYGQKMQLQIAAKPSVLCCDLADTNNDNVFAFCLIILVLNCLTANNDDD